MQVSRDEGNRFCISWEPRLIEVCVSYCERRGIWRAEKKGADVTIVEDRVCIVKEREESVHVNESDGVFCFVDKVIMVASIVGERGKI